MKRPEETVAWRPVSGRQRLVIALLAVAAAVAVVLALTGRPGGADLGQAAKAQGEAARQAECRASLQAGCVGGKAQVYAVPPKPPR